MKKKSLIAVALLLLMQANLRAQDTLILNVPQLVKARISLAFKGSTAKETETFRIPVNQKNWHLSINNPNNGKVSIINLNPFDSVVFTSATTVEVKDNKLGGTNFTLNKNFRVRVDGAGNNKLRSYEVEQTDSGPAITVTNTGSSSSGSGSAIGEYIVGSMVYDALSLAAPVEKVSQAKKYEILVHYAGTKDIRKAFEGNKFLTNLIDSVVLKNFTPAQSTGGLSSILATVGGLDVTKYADGLAKFLVKRVKQELNVAFFEKFKEIINEQKDIATLFPKTATLLNAIDVEIYEYERYIQNLREAFKADIVVIHHNLPGIVDNHKQFFDDRPILKASLLSGCYIAIELEDQAHPGDILANYPMEYLEGLSKNFSGAIQTLQVISASFKDTTQGEDANYWVPVKALRQVVNSRLALKYYLGLVYHEAKTKYDGVQFEKTNLVELLGIVAGKYDGAADIYNAYKRYVLRFAEKTDELNKMIKDYRKLPTDSAALERYGAYLRSAVDMVEYCTQFSKLPLVQDVPDLDSLFGKYFQVGYSTSDLLANISKKNYSAAINDVVKIYNLVRVQPIKNSDTTASVKAATEYTQSRLAKYGSFMATVSTAKTPDEVARAVDAAALPLGSSRIKRETSFNVAVNAYVGPYIGYEKIRGVDSAGKINAYGITAPIGFSISRGYSILFIPSKKHRTSSSIFFSLIDLGAITAFRFTNDSTEKVPTIELKDIFSPGIFYSHGFGKTPISLNIGYQAGPLLRRVRGDENDFSKSYSRFSVSLVVDIPMFNLFSRSN